MRITLSAILLASIAAVAATSIAERQRNCEEEDGWPYPIYTGPCTKLGSCFR